MADATEAALRVANRGAASGFEEKRGQDWGGSLTHRGRIL